MGIAELKEKIRLRLENADENVLYIISSVLDEQENIVAYDSLGNALNLDEYNTKIEEAFSDLKNGNVFSDEEMKSKIKTLKRRR